MRHITAMQRHVFLGSFIAVFLIVLLSHFHISPQQLLSPVPHEVDALQTILPLLQTTPRTFTLHIPHHFISQTHASGEYDQARSYAVVDLKTGTVLKEKSLDEEVSVASLTKIMTAIVALDLAKSDERFTVTKRAARQIPTKIGVIPDESLTLHELLEAAMLTSANDAVAVIQDGIDKKYGSPVFVRAMNAKAEFLRLQHTHFTNPQGFDNKNHYSSAEDLTLLTQYALTNYPEIAEIDQKDYVFLPEDAYHKQFDLYNWNGLLGVYPAISGVKIGNTDDAGKTTIVVSDRGGEKVLVVLTGAPTILDRDMWASQLLDEAYTELLGLSPVTVTEDALREKYASWTYQ